MAEEEVENNYPAQYRQPQQQRQQPVQQYPTDPFAGINPNELPPNMPMQGEGAAMISELLSDDHVSKRLRKDFFWVFGRDNALTFLDDDRKHDKMISFDILKIDTLNNTPYYSYTFEDELKWGIMRNIFDTKLDRARGFDGSATKNERIIQQSQFSENRNIQQADMGDSLKRESFIKRLLGRR